VRGVVNDCLRLLISLSVRWLGLGLSAAHRIRILTFRRSQRRLRGRYRIEADTPILTFGPALERLIEEAAERACDGAVFASTSGSTDRPKRLLYTRGRLRAVKLAFVDSFARCCRAYGVGRTSLYVFSSLGKDDSLTSLLLEEEGLPPYLHTLQAPYRVHADPALRALVKSYGAAAVRLWVLAVADPGVLYSTNPSTLSSFLDELAGDWPRASELVRRFCREPEAFDRRVQAIARRLASRGSAGRLRLIAESERPLPFRLCAPSVRAYVCWTGGYVKPFLERLAEHLPAERYRLVPMYSMSTETIETVSHFRRGRVSFLPLAPGVLYEFAEEGAEDRPENLLTAEGLSEGKAYTLVVSDAYGLRRYQTGDLFLCRGFVRGLPDLAFLRRRDLEYSFTGEKLTGEQAGAAFRRLRAEYPRLAAGSFLTCVPSSPPGASAPHYKLVCVRAGGAGADVPGEELAARFDEMLCEVNGEYEGKRASGRLGPVTFVSTTPADFARRLNGPAAGESWEAQFKFLPLYRRTWEAAEPRPAAPRSDAPRPPF
jgi:hypothetical protein